MNYRQIYVSDVIQFASVYQPTCMHRLSTTPSRSLMIHLQSDRVTTTGRLLGPVIRILAVFFLKNTGALPSSGTELGVVNLAVANLRSHSLSCTDAS